MNTAASKPAEGESLISEVKRYVAKAVRPEKPGARRTHMLRMSTGRVRKRRTW